MSKSVVQTAIVAKAENLYNLDALEKAKLEKQEVIDFSFEIMKRILGFSAYNDYINRPAINAVSISSFALDPDYSADEYILLVTTDGNHRLSTGQLITITDSTNYDGSYIVSLIPDTDTFSGYVETQFRIHQEFVATETAEYVDEIRNSFELAQAVILATLLFPFLKKLRLGDVMSDYRQYGEGNTSPSRAEELKKMHEIWYYQAVNILKNYNKTTPNQFDSRMVKVL